MLNSDYRKLCPVNLPFRSRQMYMHTFDLECITMAPGYEDYLQPVRDLCKAAGAFHGVAHMTVDEKIIVPGASQRRPKPHVDGCFMLKMTNWAHDTTNPGWGHAEPKPKEPEPVSRWSHGWQHNCNNVSIETYQRMPVIVAASAIGCRAWRGKFPGQPKSDGDLSHLELGEGEVFPANVGYLLSPDCVHESMIQESPVQRSFLRIALPVDFQF